MILQLSLWSGIITLYLGIAGAVGVFTRQAFRHGVSSTERLLAAGYTFALFLPSTAFIFALSDWPVLARGLLFVLGLAAVWVAYVRPSWAPQALWKSAFGQRYLAGVMALTALWGISQAAAGSPAAPVLIAVSAVAAGAASSGTSLSTPRLGSS